MVDAKIPLYTFYQQIGNNIFFKYRKNGKSYAKKVDFYKPSLYVKPDPGQPGDAESIFGYPLKQIQFDDIKSAREFTKNYNNVEGFHIEGNRNFANQFIVEFYQGQMPEFNPTQIRTAILDIEVDIPSDAGFPEPSEAKFPINAIDIYDNFTDTHYAFGMVDYIHDPDHEDIGHLNVEYRKFDSEIDLLNAMIDHFVEFQYDLTSGWHSEMFDMPYIVQRCLNILGKPTTSRLSPYGLVSLREVRIGFNKESVKAEIVGLPHLDYMQLDKKHSHTPRDSYKLDNVGHTELGVRKLSYEEQGSLFNLYRENPQLFTEYNIQDVNIVKMLEDKLGLFKLAYTLAYYTLSNYEDTLGTTKIWEQLVAKHLYNSNRVPLFKKLPGEFREFDGGYVKDMVPGYYEWVVTHDLNSLYPHIEMQVGIGPETYIPREELPKELLELKSKYTLNDLVEGNVDLEVLKKYNVSMAANFEFYRKDKISIFAEIKKELYEMRKVYKKQMIDAQKEILDIQSELKKRGLNYGI